MAKAKSKSGKADTPQAKKFGVAAKKARQACKSEPGSTYFKCVGREMRSSLKKGKRKGK